MVHNIDQINIDLFLKIFVKNYSPQEKWYYKSVILALKIEHIVFEQNQIIYYENRNLPLIELIFDISISIIKMTQINYNSIKEVTLFFRNLIRALINNDKLNIIPIFCPGYENNSYQHKIGKTTISRIMHIKDLYTALNKYIKININPVFADIFLENTNFNLEPNLFKDLELNFQSFQDIISREFNIIDPIRLSECPEFKDDKYFQGFISDASVRLISPKLYNAILSVNSKFYLSLNWPENQIIERTKIIITLYSMIPKLLLNRFMFPSYYSVERLFLRARVITFFSAYKIFTFYPRIDG